MRININRHRRQVNISTNTITIVYNTITVIGVSSKTNHVLQTCGVREQCRTIRTRKRRTHTQNA